MRTLILSVSCAKVLLSSSFLLSETLFWNSKWVMLQTSDSYYSLGLEGSLNWKEWAIVDRPKRTMMTNNVRFIYLSMLRCRIYMIINCLINTNLFFELILLVAGLLLNLLNQIDIEIDIDIVIVINQ